MNRKKTGIVGLILLGLAVSAAAGPEAQAPQEKTLSLSLEACILKALSNNFDLAVQVMTPETADIAVSMAGEKFIPTLAFAYNRRDTAQASFSFLEAADQVTVLRDNTSVQLNQQLPFGGSLGMTLSGAKTDTNSSFQTINPRFETQLNFSFSQPLLRNFGFDMSRREIIVAQNNLRIAEEDFAQFVQSLVYRVEEAYWNLVYAIDSLEVRKQSLALAEDLLDKNKRSVEIGTLAPIDVLNAQADVASREADVLDAQALVKNSEDVLRAVINLAADTPAAAGLKILPTDRPIFDEVAVDLDEALAAALANSPELSSGRIDIRNKELNLTYARNQLLPGLDLTAQYWSPGVSGTQILYEGGNPLFGGIIGTVPGDVSEAMKDTFNFKYRNWSVGLTLSLPLNAVFSRAAAAQAMVALDQSQALLKSREQQLDIEVRSAVRAVRTNFMRVQAYRVARELAQKKLEAEEEKLRVGLTTNYFVLQYQRDLADRQTLELRALIDYNLSLAKLAQVKGVNLKEKNINIVELMSRD
ncbi:MAG: TolC family protein [Candidatus Aminicenantes bacterium]|nr:TolC family protein [Candidatus Aminicenantes bacterium]